MDWPRPEPQEWSSALDAAVIKSLTCLKTLRLKIFFYCREDAPACFEGTFRPDDSIIYRSFAEAVDAVFN